MSKRDIKKLVVASYSDKTLDKEKVEKIADYLNRRDLKLYISELKSSELQKNVIVTLSQPATQEQAQKIKELFSDKQIIYIIDPDLLVGLRIQDNDKIFELNLESVLNNMLSYIEQYD